MSRDDHVLPFEREPRRHSRVYPRSYGKPKHAIRIRQTDVVTDEAKTTATAASPLTGEIEKRDQIVLPNGVVAVKVDARAFVFVDEEDVGSVVGYKWHVRALNSFNNHYRGLQTFWEEQDLTPAGRDVTLRYRMFLHDLLMDTPDRVPTAIHETSGPFWIVQHADYNGMNCTRRNMRMIESPDGYVPIPELNLPVGVWWNYRKHRWSVRVMPEGQWYVELGSFKTFEEAAIAYFECLDTWTPERREIGQYAWGQTIEYMGLRYSLDEWQKLRKAHREQEKKQR
jgi:hypothetical protein